MNKKLWTAFVGVFIVMVLTNFVIHGVLLKATYLSEEMRMMVRPEAEGEANLWIHIVSAFITSFFFTLIFSKGYESKGLAEGIRYGFFVGMLMSIPMAYDTYAAMPIPYHLALQWFLYGVIQYIILGIVVAMIFGKKAEAATAS
ncbi:MAG TPA: hypothetical protein VGR15_07630 [Bacteroidota bacterium]|jgi:hypothetical protein|nr:hypothetical protein [Bacteroidota bacterium]